MLLRIGNWQGAKVGRGGSPRFALRSSPRYIFRAETVAQPDTARKFIPFGPCSKDRDKDYLSLFVVSRNGTNIYREYYTKSSIVSFFRGLLIFTISLRYYRRRRVEFLSVVNFLPLLDV